MGCHNTIIIDAVNIFFDLSYSDLIWNFHKDVIIFITLSNEQSLLIIPGSQLHIMSLIIKPAGSTLLSKVF